VVAPGAAGEAMVAAALERALGPPTTGDGNNRGRSPD